MQLKEALISEIFSIEWDSTIVKLLLYLEHIL